MSERQRELYNTILELPEDLYGKIMDYIEYLKFSTEDMGAPEELIIKDKEDLIKKLSEGIEDTEKGNLIDFEDVFSEVGKILAK